MLQYSKNISVYYMMQRMFNVPINYNYMEEDIQARKITVLSVMSVGTLVSNMAILLAILTSQSKVIELIFHA